MYITELPVLTGEILPVACLSATAFYSAVALGLRRLVIARLFPFHTLLAELLRKFFRKIKKLLARFRGCITLTLPADDALAIKQEGISVPEIKA